MKVIYGFNKIKRYRKSVVAIGVFDGVHKAHRLIITSALNQARRIGAKILVLTFWPHPQSQLSLNSLSHRLRLIEELGVDVCLVVRFNRKFAAISAENFVKNILVKRLNTCAVFIGENFRFGKNSEGDAFLLEKFSQLYGFQVKVFKLFKNRHGTISSSLIRQLIRAGKLKFAEKFLLRPVSVIGTVTKGEALGARLGFPTANIEAHHEVLPPSGVYAVKIIFVKQKYAGVCYIGYRPTFFGNKQSIEVHIFNFKKNIYGQDLEIQFIRKIRAENKFPNPQSLVEQIKKDIIKAQKIACLF